MNSDPWTEHMKTITKSASLEDQALMSPQDLGQLVHAFTFSRLLWRCVHMSLKKISQKATADAERCSLSLKRTRKVDHISQYIKDRRFFYCLFHKARDLRRYFAIWIELLLTQSINEFRGTIVLLRNVVILSRRTTAGVTHHRVSLVEPNYSKCV